MDLELSEEQEGLRDSVSRFLEERAPVTPYVRSMLDDPRGTTTEVWQGLADLGALGMLVPERHGGSGMGLVDMGVVLEQAGRMVHPGPLIATAVMSVSAILAAAGAAEQADLLPRIAAGSLVSTVALYGAGQRGAASPVGATARESGHGWTLHGEKVGVPDAAAADLVLVPARIGSELALFAIDRGAEGMTIVPEASVDGTRKQAQVLLDGAQARRLGPGDAAPAMASVADRTLAAYAADGVGAAERAMEIAVAYAKERVQFDRPIGSFQAVQHLCADMLQSVELGRAGTGYALWAIDAAGAEEAHRAATMAKAYTGDALAKVGASAIQVMGGIGFTWEHDIHLYYKRLLTLQQIHGPASAHLEELAGLVL